MRAPSSLLRTLKLWQFVALLVVTLVGAVIAYRVFIDPDDMPLSDLSQSHQLYPVQYGVLKNEISTNGSLLFTNKETLTFGSQGTVAEVFVSEGDRITKDQILASLDDSNIAALETAVSQARVTLREAQDALELTEEPSTTLQIAQAQLKVANAKLLVRVAQEDAEKEAEEPSTTLQIAQAQLKVANAKLLVRAAQEAAEEEAVVSDADIQEATDQVELAKTKLSNALASADVAKEKWDNQLVDAQEDVLSSEDDYRKVLSRWLGVTISEAELEQQPQVLFDEWGVNLGTFFDKEQRFTDQGQKTLTQGPPTDDPGTRWDELTVYSWLNFVPATILPTCGENSIPLLTVCIEKEINDTWDGYKTVKHNLATILNNSSKDIVSVESVADEARDALETAQETLTDLLSGPDLLAVDAKNKQLEVEQEGLAKAEEDLAELLSGPDLMTVDAKNKQLEVEQEGLAKAEEDLAELLEDLDPLDLDLAQKDVRSARVSLRSAQESLNQAILRSPMAGIVTLVGVSEGQNVNSNAPAIEIADPSVVEVDGVVDEIDVLFVKEGTSATVSMDALPGQQLNGTVSFVSPIAVNQGGVVTYPVRIELVTTPAIQLREGLSATANIVVREENNVLLIPTQALYGSFEQPTVKVWNEGVTEERSVTLGNSDDFWVVVHEGVVEGERIVLQTPEATETTGFSLRSFRGGSSSQNR